MILTGVFGTLLSLKWALIRILLTQPRIGQRQAWCHPNLDCPKVLEKRRETLLLVLVNWVEYDEILPQRKKQSEMVCVSHERQDSHSSIRPFTYLLFLVHVS